MARRRCRSPTRCPLRRGDFRLEETAVVGGHVEVAVAAVDNLPERHQIIPQRAYAGDAQARVVDASGRFPLDALEAVLLPVGGVARRGIHRQQAARLGVEDKEQPVEHDEAVVVDGFARFGRGVDAVGRVVQKALGQLAQRVVDLPLQPVADAALVAVAALADAVEPAVAVGLRQEGRLAKEAVEVLEGVEVALIEQGGQINFVVDIQLFGAGLVVEPPEATVGQHAPIQPAVAQVEIDLHGGRGADLPVQVVVPAFGGLVQRAIPALGVGHGQRVGEVGFGERGPVGARFGGVARGAVGKEEVVGEAGFARCGKRHLHGEAVAQRLQHRTHPALLGLRLVEVKVSVARGKITPLLPQRLEGGARRRRVVAPVRARGEPVVEVVVAKEVAVAVRCAKQGRLGG